MLGADDVLVIFVVIMIANLGVEVVAEWWVNGPGASPGFEGSAAAPGGESAELVLINGVAPTPEQIEVLHTLIAALQTAQ
jgi:hypothetical protein